MRDPMSPSSVDRKPLEALGPTAQPMQLGRGAVDINVNLDRALSVGRSKVQAAEQFDIGFNVDRTGAAFARPGDPSFPVPPRSGMF